MGGSGLTVHNFSTSLGFSNGYTDAPWWEQVYRKAFPSFAGMVSVRSEGWAQRGGIDRVITLASGRTYSVDEKVRAEDWPDFLLEYWSDFGRRVPGWVAKDLACDFIAYAFAPSKKCYLLPFAQLRRAWRDNSRDWVQAGHGNSRGFHHVEAFNEERERAWTTVSIAVPIEIAMKAITDAMLVTWD